MVRLKPAGQTDGLDRGQVLLAGAAAIAVMLVVLAFVLNGAALSENLATRDADVDDERDAVSFQHAAEEATAELLVRVNRRNDTTHAALHSNLSDAVSDWDALAAAGAAEEATGTTLTLEETTNGSRIAQVNASRDFTDANASGDWTLANGTTSTRRYRLNVSRDELASTCDAGCFRIVADNGTATWRASFTRNDTAITVAIEGPDETGSCSIAADAARVDLSRGVFAGEPCEPLGFADGVEGEYDVRYVNASRAVGTYELVVDTDVDDDSRYADEDGGDPTVSPAIYSATVGVEYWTARLTYRTGTRVAPGERGG